MGNELAPPRDLQIDVFSAHAVIAARSYVHNVLLNDLRGNIYKSMESEDVLFDDVKMMRDENDTSLIAVTATARSGEIFLSARAKSNNRELFSDQPLFSSKSLCTPSFRENEDFVYSRCLANGTIRVMDDLDHDVVFVQSSKDSVFAIVNTSDPHSAYLQVVDINKISVRQPLTHWPTRVLLHSISEQIEMKIKSGVVEDSECAASHRYLINKALTTGHVDTIAINPVAILRNAGEYIKENFDDSKSKSLTVVIEKYTEDLESLSEKYADMWPRTAPISYLNPS